MTKEEKALAPVKVTLEKHELCFCLATLCHAEKSSEFKDIKREMKSLKHKFLDALCPPRRKKA